MSIQDNVVDALLAQVALQTAAFWASDYGLRCGSEIERAFAATMLIGVNIRSDSGVAMSRLSTSELAPFFLEPQVEIGQYRVDFLFGCGPDREALLSKYIVIECDGHDFHDRTKEQAARDKSRDRYLSTQVGKVIRFTGSEIYRDPTRCVVEALGVLRALLDAQG